MNGLTLPMALLLSVGFISLFSYITVSSWSKNRRREREAYYKSEALKKISEMGADAVAILREQERNARRRRLEGNKLGGLVTAGVGIGMMVFLRAAVPDRPSYLVGLIPVLIAVALLAYSYILAPKD
jgi:hypothetical protein